MKKIITILDYEKKLTKAEKVFMRFKTSDGWMSCFDKKTYDELSTHKGDNVSVEVKTQGDFSNISAFYKVEGESSPDELDEDENFEVEKIETKKPANKQYNTASFYTAYAKDIFVAIHQKEVLTHDTMALAIELVKQAKEAFE